MMWPYLLCVAWHELVSPCLGCDHSVNDGTWLKGKTMTAGVTSGNRFRSWPEILANAARAAGGLRVDPIRTQTALDLSARFNNHEM
jgi:hypothetical protein